MELKVEQDKILRLQAFNSNNFLSIPEVKSVEDDGTQKYFVF